jgi:RNA polymerase sigma-70 factor (ECF subfamily)
VLSTFLGKFRNFITPYASNSMSTVSGASFEAERKPSASGLAGGDGDLIRLVQAGDRAAYAQIVLAYQDRLYNAVLRLVGDPDEASEITQEAFTRGLMKIENFRGDASAYTWLFRIAMNLAITELRKVRRHRVFSIDRPSYGGGSGAGGRSDGDDQAASLVDRVSQNSSNGPHEIVERRERDTQVLAALGRLDPDYRAALVMRDIEGFDYQQMAEVLDVPLGTLKSRLFRARLALRDELKQYMEGQ